MINNLNVEDTVKTALFINGIYNGVLVEILKAREKYTRDEFFLQPEKGHIIRMLKKTPPTPESPVRLYLSTTKNLSQICYTAEIIGWEDKRELSENRRKEVAKHCKDYQPGEAEYFAGFDESKKKAFNLITVRSLTQLDTLYSTTLLRKRRDGNPLKPRTRSGGWSEVYDTGDLIDLPVETEEQLDLDLYNKVKEAHGLSDEELKRRLENASDLPEKVQVISIGYRRNPDVIVAVLRRASGICEKCKQAAPFLRRSNESPYLEVHHRHSLGEGGQDKVENATALCPNCHRECHYGLNSDEC